MEKEDFINRILNSVDGISTATPNDVVFQKIENKINENKISTSTMWLVAASIVVLISFNIVLLNEKFNDNETEMASLEQSINNKHTRSFFEIL